MKEPLKTVWNNPLLGGRVGGLLMQKESVSFLQNLSHNLTSHKSWQYVVSVCDANPARTFTS